MKRIYTVQHTQSEHHTNGMVGSWTDWNLTDLGKQQADRIAEKLKQELDGKEIILYTSDLKRAKQTADSIASRFRVEPIVRKELRERNLGRCCGKSVQWLRENLECDEKAIDDRLFSDAESRRDEWNRLKPFFDQVMAEDSVNIIIALCGKNSYLTVMMTFVLWPILISAEAFRLRKNKNLSNHRSIRKERDYVA